MNSWLNWTFVSRAIGIFVILLGASTWPDVHWEGVIAGLGFLGSPEFFPGKKK